MTTVSFNKFSERFLKMNPDSTKASIKKSYAEEQKRQATKTKNTFVAIPSITAKVQQQQPEISPEVLAPPLPLPDQVIQDPEADLEITKRELINGLLTMWEQGLRKVINDAPVPLYPKHPTKMISVSPLDLYRTLSRLTVNPDSSDPQFPFLITLISSPETLHQVYTTPNTMSFVTFFTSKGFTFTDKWSNKLLPNIREEFIDYQMDTLTQKYPKILDFNELLDAFILSPELTDTLYGITNTHEFLKVLVSSPGRLKKITDVEIGYFNMDPSVIREILSLVTPKERKQSVADIYRRAKAEKKKLRNLEVPPEPLPEIVGGATTLRKWKLFKFLV